MSFTRFKKWAGPASGVAIAASAVLSFGGVALADNLQDSIVGTGTVALVAGSSTGGSAEIRVVGNNSGGDPDPGCNWDGASEAPLTLDVVTPTGVTASPDPLSITECGTNVTVTFTAGASAQSGTATVSILSTPAGDGTYKNDVSIPITVTQPTPSNTGPTVTVANKPPSLVEGNTAGGANVSWGPVTVTDDHDSLTATCSDGTKTVESPAFFALGGPYTVSCSATDAGALADDDSFTFSVTDTTAPALAPHAGETVEATSAAGAIVNYTNPTATDAVDASPTVDCVPPSGSAFPLGDTTVNCTATDDSSNQSGSSFTVTVEDTTAPALAPHAGEIVEATSAAGAIVNYTNPTATDAVDSTPTVECIPPSGSAFPLGDTTVNCTATDDFTNQSGSTFTVTVRDTTAPTLAAHADVTAEATSAAGATVGYTNPTATDAVDSTPTVECVPPSGSTFPLGDTTVDCTATDDFTNQSGSTFTVTVRDTTAPTLAAHADVTVSATSAAGAIVNYTNPTASDAVDSSPAVACTPASGSTFAPGTTTVRCTATDEAGNESLETTFKVIVKFDLKGFYQPVDMSTGSTIVWNTVKNGSTVPLKFEVFAGATELTTTSTINQPLKAVGVSCGTAPVTDDIELVATGGTVLRYDTTGGQFIYNWQTPKKPGACYKVTVETADGSSISAFFLLK